MIFSSTNNANSIDQTNQLFTFPAGAVKSGQDNVITVVQVSSPSAVAMRLPDGQYFPRTTWVTMNSAVRRFSSFVFEKQQR